MQRFCWECSCKLVPGHFDTVHVDGHDRIVHKECARLIREDRRAEIVGKEERGPKPWANVAPAERKAKAVRK